jgi:hypothetical protein
LTRARLKGAALSFVGRNDLCDGVERPALKVSYLLQAAANEQIHDCAECAAAGASARGFDRGGRAGTPAIIA